MAGMANPNDSQDTEIWTGAVGNRDGGEDVGLGKDSFIDVGIVDDRNKFDHFFDLGGDIY